MSYYSQSSSSENEGSEDGDSELLDFAKAAGVVAGIAAFGAGIAAVAGSQSSSSKNKEASEKGDDFAKAAGVMADIAIISAGIAGVAGLFSAFSNASSAVPEPSKISSIKNNESNRFVSKPTADGKGMVRWVPPPQNWVKINTDGASQGNPGYAGMGGLIRDSSGAWKVGFMKPLGVLGCVEAELKAIEAGLQLAWSEGYRRVLLETDSQPALDYINGNVRRFTPVDPLFGLVANIKELIERFYGIELSHVLREANKCADVLANMSIRFGSYPRIMSPPEALLKHLQADMEGAWILCR